MSKHPRVRHPTRCTSATLSAADEGSLSRSKRRIARGQVRKPKGGRS